MRQWIVVITLCLGLVTGCSTGPHARRAMPGYELVWADEFNKDGPPDPANWTYELGFVRNEEAQWYQPDNARCQGGLLIIEARRERKQNPQYRPASNNWKQSRQYAEYTSASMTTRGLHSWMYGRFEMRGRIDTRAGLWPAFWSLGIERPWPACGEIDIMEYYRGTLLANAAWSSPGRRGPQWDTAKTLITDFNEPKWSSRFHVWRMDWDPNCIKLYVDDRLLNTVELDKTSADAVGIPVHAPYMEPRRPFRLVEIRNQGLGGVPLRHGRPGDDQAALARSVPW